ncbi:hypothetical protein ABKN59_000092 [Abortiporus biennis]
MSTHSTSVASCDFGNGGLTERGDFTVSFPENIHIGQTGKRDNPNFMQSLGSSIRVPSGENPKRCFSYPGMPRVFVHTNPC